MDSGDCTTVATQPRQLHYSNNLSKKNSKKMQNISTIFQHPHSITYHPYLFSLFLSPSTMFSDPYTSDRLARPTGRSMRTTPRESLKTDFTSGEYRPREREGRRAVWPGSSHDCEILHTNKRPEHSVERGRAAPPPYGVGKGVLSSRQTGRKFTTLSNDMASTPLRITDEVSPGRSPLSPGRRYNHVPKDGITSVFLPPTGESAKHSTRSRSCPPLSLEYKVQTGLATSPLKTISDISTRGGAMAGGDTRWKKPSLRVNQGLKHEQHFVVSMQSHAEGKRSRSHSPQVGEATPPSYASKRRFCANTFHGSGTADAMNNWHRPSQYQFAKKNRSHQNSSVGEALTGRGLPEAPRGRKGVLGHTLTYRSHSVTIPSKLPQAPASPSKGHSSDAYWAHTRLW